MSVRTVSVDDPCAGRRCVPENDKVDTDGYEADEEDNDSSYSDSSIIKGDIKHILVSVSALTSRRRRRNSSLANLLSSINPPCDEMKATQFVTIIRSYCEKQADYLQLQRNFLAARHLADDQSHDGTLSTCSNTIDVNVIGENDSYLSD